MSYLTQIHPTPMSSSLTQLSIDERIAQENAAQFRYNHPEAVHGLRRLSRKNQLILAGLLVAAVATSGTILAIQGNRQAQEVIQGEEIALSDRSSTTSSSITRPLTNSGQEAAGSTTPGQSSLPTEAASNTNTATTSPSSTASSQAGTSTDEPLPLQATGTTPEPNPGTSTAPIKSTPEPMPSSIVPTINVATYNIRATELTPWDSTRANAILGYIKSVEVTGLQEGRETSINWLTPRLDSAGYQRTTNKWARQVVWNRSLFTVIKQGDKALPNDKDLVWAKLRHNASGKIFYFATVHNTVHDSPKRVQELKVALPYMTTYFKDAPIIFVGDMNAERKSAEDKLILSYSFKNSYDIATQKINLTWRSTLSGFTGKLTGTIDKTSTHQIDHIYVRGNLAVSRIEIVNQRGSDHLPVEADIRLK